MLRLSCRLWSLRLGFKWDSRVVYPLRTDVRTFLGAHFVLEIGLRRFLQW